MSWVVPCLPLTPHNRKGTNSGVEEGGPTGIRLPYQLTKAISSDCDVRIKRRLVQTVLSLESTLLALRGLRNLTAMARVSLALIISATFGLVASASEVKDIEDRNINVAAALESYGVFLGQVPGLRNLGRGSEKDLLVCGRWNIARPSWYQQ